MNDYGRFLLKISCFLFSAYAALFVTGQVIEHKLDWRSVQDPRKRLLWDSKYDGSRIVMLGDSEFSSFGVDTPDKMLGSQLASFTGQKVFPGALDGAKGADILAATRCVAEQWPKGTVVFVDIVPSRFFFTETDANYKSAFENIVRTPSANFGDQVRNVLVFPIINRLFVFHNAEAVNTYLLHLSYKIAGRPEAPFFRNDISRNRVWDRDGDFALNRYQLFEENFGKGKPSLAFDFIKELMHIGKNQGVEVVFVLTPLNVELVKRYAKRVPAQAVLQRFDDTHTGLVTFLNGATCPYLDLYSAVPSEGFADLIHTNEKGDGIIARQMADWFADHHRF